MEDAILTIIRDGWPVTTAEILHDLQTMQSQGLLGFKVDAMPTEEELAAMVEGMQEAGKVEAVRGGWKWIAPKPEPVAMPLKQRSLLDVC